MAYEVIILGHLHMPLYFLGTFTEYPKKEKATFSGGFFFFGWEWALTDSNRRPSACKADALNQLS